MNKQEIKLPYVAPTAQYLKIYKALNLLASVSAEAGIEDWEEGDEL